MKWQLTSTVKCSKVQYTITWLGWLLSFSWQILKSALNIVVTTPTPSIFRPNLYLSVAPKSPSMANDLRSIMTRSGRSNNYSFDGSTVIYCPTRKQTESCQAVLESKWGAYLSMRSVQYPSDACAILCNALHWLSSITETRDLLLWGPDTNPSNK